MRNTVASWRASRTYRSRGLHRRIRRLFRRSACKCGLRWPCPDYLGWPSGTPIPDGTYRGTVSPTWHGVTIMNLPQVGRAGTLTPAQRVRAGVL